MDDGGDEWDEGGGDVSEGEENDDVVDDDGEEDNAGNSDDDENSGEKKDEGGDDGDEEEEQEGAEDEDDAFAFDGMDEEVQKLLSFDALKQAAKELTTFPRIPGPAAVLLERSNDLYKAGQYATALRSYLRTLKEAESGLETYLVLVTLLNAGECSMHVTEPDLKALGESLLRRAMDQIDQNPGPQARASCHEYIVHAARYWWAAELKLPEPPKKTKKKRRKGSKKGGKGKKKLTKKGSKKNKKKKT
ncbi:hypothetical protein PTSG_06543 [Salpingoeca rosetta]|uniref:Uncharacterized protein n=1 Tax=Salpingoeca rosetta (strain ATCC 50818 / BSB-021) TaxID=946362 RepID=F2UG41_SALR5|nr:uncharacterized protein PTSG_06543 [Salpingoeca rosetta]EGD75469.1 hypothetical protein PTSG_06543 [Salpingoeca rosetta]|eukprot:XP_004991926.1 hypothetical protein PTSG_06543 [Salpingoeca rosetta]